MSQNDPSFLSRPFENPRVRQVIQRKLVEMLRIVPQIMDEGNCPRRDTHIGQESHAAACSSG